MDELMAHINSIQLPFLMDDVTPGRGNCFFSAVCQQMRRPELALENLYTHQSLRKCTCEFALALKDPRVVTLGGNFNRNAIACKSRPWDVFFNDMKKNGTWAEEPVVYCLAWLLSRDIIVISMDCTINNPWLFIDGSGSNFPPIILANIAGVHFQSLLPNDSFQDFFDNNNVKNMAPVASTIQTSTTPSTTLSTIPSTTLSNTPRSTTSSFPKLNSTPSTPVGGLKRKSIDSGHKSPSLMSFKDIQSLGKKSQDCGEFALKSLNATFTSQIKTLNDLRSELAMTQVEVAHLLSESNKSVAHEVKVLIGENRKLRATVLRQQFQIKMKEEELERYKEKLAVFNNEQFDTFMGDSLPDDSFHF